MAGIDRAEIIGELEQFVVGLKEYQFWHGQQDSSGRTAQLLRLGEQLTQKAGQLQPLIESIVGETRLMAFEMAYNPWFEAFDAAYGNPRIPHSLNALILLSNHVIQAVHLGERAKLAAPNARVECSVGGQLEQARFEAAFRVFDDVLAYLPELVGVEKDIP